MLRLEKLEGVTAPSLTASRSCVLKYSEQMCPVTSSAFIYILLTAPVLLVVIRKLFAWRVLLLLIKIIQVW